MTDEQALRLRVLGGLSLMRGSERLSDVLSGSKRTALLVYLALGDAEQVHERDAIMVRFWPEATEAKARASFRQLIHVLRKELGPEIIESEGSRVRLKPGSVSCDALDFCRLLEEGRPAEALDLYKGELLEGFHLSGAPELSDWIDTERRALAQRAAGAAWKLTDAAEAAGDGRGAVRWARKAVGLAPFNERGFRRLIDLLDRRGNRAEALAAYDELAQRLERQWEVDPSPETQALIEGVRERRERVEEGLPDTAASAEEPSSAPFQESPAHEPSPVELAGASEGSGVIAATEVSDNPTMASRPSAVPLAPLPLIAIGLAAIGWIALGGGDAVGGGDDAPSTSILDDDRTSVVVLRFDHRGDAAQEYMASGVTEEIRLALSTSPDVLVKGLGFELPSRQGRGLGELGRLWGVDQLLYGSVRTQGDQVRVTAYLVDADTEQHVWSEAFDGSTDDVFALQARVARAVASGLGTKLGARSEATIPTNAAAYALYEQGVRQYFEAWVSGFPATAEEVLTTLRGSVALDSSFAPARAWLGKTFFALGGSTRVSTSVDWTSARDSAVAHAQAAYEMAPDDPDVLLAANQVGIWIGDRTRANQVLERYADYSPLLNNVAFFVYSSHRTTLDSAVIAAALAERSVPPALSGLGWGQGARALSYLGMHEEAMRWVQAARRTGSFGRGGNAAWIEFMAGHEGAARSTSDAWLRADSSDAMQHQVAGDLALARGDYEIAAQLYRQGISAREARLVGTTEAQLSEARHQMGHPHTFGQSIHTNLAFALSQLGAHSRAEEHYRIALDEHLDDLSGGIDGRLDGLMLRAKILYSIARIHAQLGSEDEALQWFERAVEAGWYHYHVALRDPLIEPLRGDSRFEELMAEVRADLDETAARAQAWIDASVELPG